ncbi:MAG: biosynthetic-type acetolactate synthase large subunit [Candidatus Bathyarchaeia archaeon]
MTGAQAVVEVLEREGVEAVFGHPGGANMPIYDVLYDHQNPREYKGIRHILARHEQSAAHMADGYARASGRVGVCMATSGPGATNLMTGLATAYMDSSSVVAITGQVPTFVIGTDGFQESDVVGMATSVTKYAFQPLRVRDVPYMLKAAFYLAATRRPQPVLVDIPKDVQQGEDDVEFPDHVNFPNYQPLPDPDPTIVKTIARTVLTAERPIILAGGGVKMANAYRELQAFAELLVAPVATSFMGKGVFPENHPLSLGCMGMHGSERTNKLLPECDVLLVIGSRFSDRTTGKIEKFCPNTKVIHIDADKAEIGKNYKLPVVSLVADAKKALQHLIREVEAGMLGQQREGWIKKTHDVMTMAKSELDISASHLSGVETIKMLRRFLPSKAIVTTEVGQHQMWCEQHFQVIEPRTFFSSGGLGTMGFGFPAALGAKVARPDVPVIDIAGDGSFLMTENSLATSIEEQIPVTVIILNNQMLGMVAQWQRFFYKSRYSSVHLGKVPDYVKLAEAYGATGVRVNTIPELESAVTRAIQSNVTTVIDVPISPEENVLPMLPPGAGIKEMIIG